MGTYRIYTHVGQKKTHIVVELQNLKKNDLKLAYFFHFVNIGPHEKI